MATMIADPQLLASAAADAHQINAALSQARVVAAGPTTSVVVAAGDEISAAAAQVFGTYGAQYQGLLQEASAFHDQFAAALAAAAGAYAGAEAEAANLLAGAPVPAATNVDLALILGPTGTPRPSLKYDVAAYNSYISRHFTTGNLVAVSTPEGFYPITGVRSETGIVSINQGIQILENAIVQQVLTNVQSPITVFGYSQSAIIASLILPQLPGLGVSPSNVSFVFVGNELTPNGGLFARFPGLVFPSIGLDFYGAMPTNTGYQVYNYTLEYDGFADFPQYPINLLSDLNAVAGIALVHTTYLSIPQSQIDTAIVQPTSPGYNGGTTFYMIPTQNLPLLAPLRLIPFVGNPIADLIQPDLRYLVNWGYGDPNYGWSTGYADVATPFGLFPPLSATTALPPLLASGAQQGVTAFMGDLQNEGLQSIPQNSVAAVTQALSTPPASPGTWLSPSALINDIEIVKNANTQVAGGFSYATSQLYATLLPTADIANAVVITLPSYDANLFLDGINQAITGQPVQGIINAIGDPIAADVGIGSFAVGVEGIVLLQGVQGALSVSPLIGTAPI
jgi:hypothetical protein